MPPAPSRAEYVTIDGFPIPCLAIEVRSLLPLWHPAPVRGSNVVIPHRSGVKPRPRRKTEGRRQLNLVVYGFYDLADMPATDVRETLEANLFEFQDTIVEPAPGDGTRAAVLHLPSGATRSGPITIENFEYGALGPTSVRAVLDVSLPDGELAEDGS